MTYANLTRINLGIAILMAIMYLVGFALMLINEEKYKKISTQLQKISLRMSIIIAIIAVIFIYYRTEL